MREPRTSKPLLPPTTLNNCGPRCLSITLHYEQPMSIVLHDLSPGWKLGIAFIVGALSV
jgi:hypothetical protein